MRAIYRRLCGILVVFSIAAPAASWSVAPNSFRVQPHITPRQIAFGWIGAVDTFELADFTFDFGTSCTPQGWLVSDLSRRGSFGGLFPGLAVLQQDPCLSVATCVWGFFNNSPDNYGCGGVPQQAVVPRGNGQGLYLSNEIWSPPIGVVGAGNEFRLSFLVYRDLPLDNLVFYSWRIRSLSEGVAGPWRTTTNYFYSGEKDWLRVDEDLSPLVDSGADQVQIALGVHDLAGVWGGVLGSGLCHSNAPLFDKVRFVRIDRPGPAWNVSFIHLFQDNFAADGTATGFVRADAAIDVNPRSDPSIRPGDSVCVSVAAFDTGLGFHQSGVSASGPAVYCHVANIGTAKAGDVLSGDLLRWPVVSNDGAWTVIRMDTAFSASGQSAPNRYCVDLNDHVFTPGDTILYFFSARDAAGVTSYWSRQWGGQGAGFVTPNPIEVTGSPLEFTCLPANGLAGGDILYVDGVDDRAGPPQNIFDRAFGFLSIKDAVDRYDVLDPSALGGNGPGSRVKDAVAQLLPYYKRIIWSTGTLADGLLGDGTIDKSRDIKMLADFLDNAPANAGVYLVGDHVASELARFSDADALRLKSFIPYGLVADDHVAAGEPVSPVLAATLGSFFEHAGIPDQIVAFGGCPGISAFDILLPGPTGRVEMAYQPNVNRAAVISHARTNAQNSEARVVLSGFGFEAIRNVSPSPASIRWDHLRDILLWLQGPPVGPGAFVFTNVTAQVSGENIQLMWDFVTSASVAGFRVYRTREGAASEELLNPDSLIAPQDTQLLDTSPVPGLKYRYEIAATLVGSTNEWRSEPVAARVPGNSPAADFIGQNFPNPFNPDTAIPYAVGARTHVSIKVYDVRGKLVRTLVNEIKDPAPGGYVVAWDGANSNGTRVSSGVYFYRIVTRGFENTRRLVVVR